MPRTVRQGSDTLHCWSLSQSADLYVLSKKGQLFDSLAYECQQTVASQDSLIHNLDEQIQTLEAVRESERKVCELKYQNAYLRQQMLQSELSKSKTETKRWKVRGIGSIVLSVVLLIVF